MAAETEYWYVRDGGRVTGPFTRAELDCRRDRGLLAWSHQVSQDRLVWVSASTLPPPTAGTKAGRARRRRGASRIAFASAAAAACIGASWIFWGGAETEPIPAIPTATPVTSPPSPGPTIHSRIIHSPEAESEISSAVGFVVCARTLQTFDGTRTEIPWVTGTCFAISEQGYLLTNRHVVEKISKYRDSEERKAAEKKTGLKIEPGVWVFFFKKPERKIVKKPATVVFQTNPNDEIDLAILKIDVGSEPLPFYFRLAPSGSEEGLKAREVYALGFPATARLPISEEKDLHQTIKMGTRIEDLFQESDFDYVTERGIVNVVRKETGKTRKTIEWILHGAKISRGNSGGPLITRDAAVVGINTLVQRVVSDDVSNYLALGITQIREELIQHVPEIREQLAGAGSDREHEQDASDPHTDPDTNR